MTLQARPVIAPLLAAREPFPGSASTQVCFHVYIHLLHGAAVCCLLPLPDTLCPIEGSFEARRAAVYRNAHAKLPERLQRLCLQIFVHSLQDSASDELTGDCEIPDWCQSNN